MQRKRRSLIGSQGPSSSEGAGGAGESPETSSAEAAPSEAPSASPADPFAAPAEPPAAEPEPSDPFGGAAPEEAFSGPSTSGAPDPFGGSPPPDDPFGNDPFGGGDDPFGGDDIRAEVKENANAAGGLYSSHGRAHDDTTDSGWGNSAFARNSEPSLPPGWGTPAPAPTRGNSLGAQKPIKTAFGEDEPPTEEAPSATFDDRAPAVGAPMNVPEPPPIPGLFDRFTPAPPAQRAGKSFSGGEGRPKFEASPPPGPPGGPSYLVEEEAPKPKAESKPLTRPAPKKEEDDDDEDEPKGGIPLPFIAFGAVVVAGMFLGVVLLVIVGAFKGDDQPVPPPSPVVVPVPVAKPVVVPPPPVPSADTDAPSGMSETTATTAPVEGSATGAAAVVPGSAPTTDTPKASEPAKAKTTKPKSEPKTVGTPKPSGATGTLKIRSNRRVLVKVNGQPRDYSPLDLPIAAGTYTVSAALPGKPDSEQTVTVTLQSGAIEPVNFTF